MHSTIFGEFFSQLSVRVAIKFIFGWLISGEMVVNKVEQIYNITYIFLYYDLYHLYFLKIYEPELRPIYCYFF